MVPIGASPLNNSLLAHSPRQKQRPRKFDLSASLFSDLCRKLDWSLSFTDPARRQFSGNKYEIFLSFSREEDTQVSLASRLYSSLREARISAPDDDISVELLPSIIESSEISIIIFSIQYVSSRRCLEELTKVMEFRRTRDHVILPIFYGVDPSTLRNLESGPGQEFREHIKRISPAENEVLRWMTAVREAGGNYGFVVSDDFDSKNESEVIQNIIKRVRHILDTKDPFSRDGLVGVSSQVQEVIKMLQKHQSEDVVSIGIWGMGGSGKTTLARLVFEHIQYEFKSRCFLSNVRKEWKREGQAYLQKKLLSVICEATDVKIDSIESTSLELKKRLCHKKVLLVLDDVIHLEQLHALCGSSEWFGEGSRIIITTRDKHLLEAFQEDRVYTMKLLGDHESLDLFCRKAFKQASPEGKFIELSTRVVAYAEGLPLALEVLGSIFYGQSCGLWESMLMKLSIIPPDDIYQKLKPSFDSLDGNGKDIFLNLVFFYIGEKIDDAIQNLEGRGYNARTGIRDLQFRSLVTIDEDRLRMHNSLQLMGRQIISRSPQNELPKQGDRYEVFLSFRGEDTRATFTSHLYKDLDKAGIIVFKDDIELPRGNHIKTELLQAIRSSKIAIIIFSKEYAGSKWCLEELSIIMKLHKSNGQVVLPVFYHMDPSDVRHQTSGFGEAFQGLTEKISPPKFEVHKWATALREAGEIAGIVVPGYRDEGKIVTDLVEEVCCLLNKKDMDVAEHPVGVDDRVQEVITMLQNYQSKDVIMVGIWGMGGVGKTTIAKAVYNAIGHNEIGRTFESRSYLSNIRKCWGREEGKVSLQKQLLSNICMPTKTEINNTESGKIILRDRLCHKKALVVLDDVDKPAQLNDLVGSPCWFGRGSIIIITTRNQCLLRERDCGVYTMKNLDEGESIELFSWYAFKQTSPKKDFNELSRDIVAYSGGLPLALKVLGRLLFGGEAKEWKSVLEKLKKSPFKEIQDELKTSFDGLSDDFNEKDIFLDICCFFIGMDRKDVTRILKGCGFAAHIGIKTLEEQSLVTIQEENKLGMHDLLRDMGRGIIRERSQYLGKRSRLWFHEDARTVLLRQKGTKDIEGLSMKSSKGGEERFETKAFKKMEKLRLLHLENIQLGGDYKYINGALRWLCWHGFPVEHIPKKFYQEKLVVMELKYSNLRQVWRQPQLLVKLKILNLSHSHYLADTPDFSKLPNLKKLIFKDCPNLSKIDDSIELLDKLLLLDLEDCIGLRSLTSMIYRLKSLKTLILSGCINIENLEEIKEQMKHLTTLLLPTRILPEDGLEIPDSFCATNCMDISTLKNSLAHHVIQIGNNSQVFCSLSKSVLQGLNFTKYGDGCILPDDNDPYWRTFKGEGDFMELSTSEATNLIGTEHKREEEEEEAHQSVRPRKAKKM
ncbi:TMV resistance protein N-like [Neltuma alba]|uniref:TMV resistance protein N-like n=1 Tax=Neltuma alba TaxID=207710 RepID=UPI0010A48411|nr:TMV resistance protein N-like [Prosopis alba]